MVVIREAHSSLPRPHVKITDAGTLAVKLTVYQLEILPPAFGLCATDDFGSLYFHPGLISSEANSRASRQRALVFFHVENALVGLCPMSWARAIALESEPYLERILYRGIETATGSLECETVRASFPGDPEHTDALLKAIGGSDN